MGLNEGQQKTPDLHTRQIERTLMFGCADSALWAKFNLAVSRALFSDRVVAIE